MPFLIRYPLADRRVVRIPVSAVDLAPTILELTGIEPGAPIDGLSLAPLILGADEEVMPGAVFSEWVGDHRIPAWWQLRTEEFAYVELGTGERELYDLRHDPFQLVNVADDPRYGAEVASFAVRLAAFRSS